MLDIILSLGKGVNSGRVGYRVHDLDMEILKDEKRHYIKQQKPSPGHPPSDGLALIFGASIQTVG